MGRGKQTDPPEPPAPAQQATGAPRRHAPGRRRGSTPGLASPQQDRLLAEHAPVGLYLTDAAGEFTYANPVWLDIAGLTLEQALGTSWLNALHEEDQERIAAAWKATVAGGDPWDIDCRFRDKHGGANWVHGTAHPIAGPDGQVLGYAGADLDITDRIRAEDELRASEARTRALADFTYDWEYWLAPDGSFLYASPSCERITGYAPEEFLTDPELLLRIVHPDDRQAFQRHLDERLAGDLEPVGLEFRIEHRSGEVRWIGHASQAVVDADDIFQGVRASNRDITAHRQADEALRANEALLRGMFDAMPSGCAIYEVRDDGARGNDYIVKYFNRAGLEMRGETLDEVVGRPITEIRPGIEEFGLVRVWQRVWQTGEPEFYPSTLYVDEKYQSYFENHVFKLPDGKIVAIYDDVTERKQAEEAVRASESFLDSIIERSPHAMWISDAEGTLIRLNQACRELLHITDEDVVGRYNVLEDNIVEEHGYMPLVRRVFEAGETAHFTLHYDSGRLEGLDLADAVSVVLEVTISPVLDDSGHVVHAIIQHVDITERTRAEENLRQKALMLQSISDVVITTDLDFTIQSWNGAAEALYGWTEAEVVGKPVGEVLPTSYRSQTREEVLAQFTEQGHWHGEVLQRRKDGESLSVQSSVSLVRDEAGRPLNVMAINRDVTERRQSEEALREANERLAMAQRAADAGVWDWDLASGKLTWSPEFYDLFGLPPQAEASFETWRAALHPDDREAAEARITSSIEQHVPLENEYRIVRPDGQVIWIAAMGDTLYDEEGRPTRMTGICVDIQERKLAEQAVVAGAQRLRATLHDTVRALGSVVELRDPYTASHEKQVTGLADAMAREMGLDDERREGLMVAAEVHDVGKIGVPAEILSKPAQLSEIEFRLIKQHPAVGRDIMRTIDFTWPVADIVAQHHERLDGSGYPDGLAGDEILLEARILAVADVVEAMSSHRPYRPALGLATALAEVRHGAGTRYDADAVAACERVMAAGFEFGS